jgi:hypothetical protein
VLPAVPQERIIGQAVPEGHEVTLANETGLVINRLAIKLSVADAESYAILGDGLGWQDGETARIYYVDPPPTRPADPSPAPEPEVEVRQYVVALRTQFDLEIEFRNAQTAELHNLDLYQLSDFSAAAIKVDPATGVFYLEFMEPMDEFVGVRVSTLEAEKANAEAEAEQRAAQAQAEADQRAAQADADQRAAEAQAEADQRASEAQATQNAAPTSGGGYGWGPSTTSGSSGGGAASQSEDQCVDDIILRPS